MVGFATTYMQSVPITTKVVSSNPVHGEVYSIQYYWILKLFWQCVFFFFILFVISEFLKKNYDCRTIGPTLYQFLLDLAGTSDNATNAEKRFKYEKEKRSERIFKSSCLGQNICFSLKSTISLIE
jgi:hypothetical protein